MMRALTALAVAASLPAAVSLAQDFAGQASSQPVPGVVQVDAEALRAQTLSDQVACRDGTVAAAPTDLYTHVVYGSPLTTAVGAVAASVVDSVQAERRMRQRIDACMTGRGYTPVAATAEDEARFESARADGHADPWELIVRYAPAPSRVTTVVTSAEGPSGAVRTYAVGRF